MLNIVTWLWGDKYGADDVAKLKAGLSRHLHQPYRFFVAAPEPEDKPLTSVPGCFVRLRMFDPQWQAKELKVGEGDRIVCIDLDVVVTGDLNPVFDRPEPFVILKGANAANPCPYNGSLWMLRAGYRPDVFREFSIWKAKDAPFYEFPDDQGWFAYMLPDAAGWDVGPSSGIYAFQKPGWPKGEALPEDTRLVVFPGWRSPAKFAHVPWIAEHWR